MDCLGSARRTLDVWLCHGISVKLRESVVFLMNDDNDKGWEVERYSFLEASFHSEVLLWIMGNLQGKSKPRRKRQVDR